MVAVGPIDEGGIFLIRAGELRTRSLTTPGVGLGGLVPCTDSAVLGGFPFVHLGRILIYQAG